MFCPIAAIRPPRMTIVPFAIVPRVAVRIVPPRIATAPDGGRWPPSAAHAARQSPVMRRALCVIR
jgi:hypothetical protein